MHLTKLRIFAGTRSMRVLRSLCILLLLSSLALTGSSAQAGGVDEKAARAHFQKAERAFSLGRFAEALASYEAAYETKPLPGFLFNIAQCHRNLEEHEKAIFFFERYLELTPDAFNRRLATALIAEQQAQLHTGTAPPAFAAPNLALASAQAPLPAEPSPLPDRALIVAAVPPPSGAPPSTSPRDGGKRSVHKRWWLWVAGGLVVVGGASVALLLAREKPLPEGNLGSIDRR
jgi:hypothetical protein